MTFSIIVTLCILILIAYLFDLSSKHTRIPTVIFLLVLGWGVHRLTDLFKIEVPDLNPLLPILGTIGLILIVLEGGLELKLKKSNKDTLTKSTLSAIISLLLSMLAIGFAFHIYTGENLMTCFLNAIPLCIVSSAIAIPSAENISRDRKTFIIYESSLSDIFGVVLFNFFLVNEIIDLQAFGNFFLEILIMLVVSIIASSLLALLIKRIDHHVKFLPIIIMIILIYEISKFYHLPALIFILIFGLLVNNIDEIKSKIRFIDKINTDKLTKEVGRFREIVIEFTFLVRTMFFLLFGYIIDTKAVLDPKSLMIAGGIVLTILIIRLVYLSISRIPILPLLFIAPRGLITILLFLSIPLTSKLPFVTRPLMIQVILLSTLVMMFGLMFHKKKEIEDEEENIH
ncbi:cation:proton antiporter [Crocinitomicaceae bacterium]|nr:cation:proton antiporter [Crocinitomicaceae bacterium]